MRLDADRVARIRLDNQYLGAARLKTAGDVVRALGAVQAQDYAGAKWALAQRTVGATDAEVEREIADGRILRTHVLRPTWHFVDPADIRWMLALTGPRVKRFMSSYDRKLELTPEVYRKSNDAIAKALAGGRHLMRSELAKAIERAGVRIATGQRLAHLVMGAELDAVVCSGARQGKQFTYGLLDERVSSAAPLQRDEALAELSRRYFATRGPASARDFAWWSGLTAADTKRGIEMLGRELIGVTVGDQRLWLREEHLTVPKRKTSAHLLPNYDEYFIGYKDRGAIAQRIGSVGAVTGGNALIANVVFVDGQLVGGWKRVTERQAMVVELDIVAKLTPPERRRVAEAARQLGEYLEVPVTVRDKPRPPAGRRKG